jgi:hypothetical protein
LANEINAVATLAVCMLRATIRKLLMREGKLICAATPLQLQLPMAEVDKRRFAKA